jgi:phosphatidylethanolamine-binding protein (PEBP) family uncharacterized protein
MKFVLAITMGFFSLFVFAPNSIAADLKVSHTDPIWTGKDVPEKGICKRHDGKGISPSLKVSRIPSGTSKLVLKFTDYDYGDEGGHGVFEVAVSGKSEINIPSIEGEVGTTDKLPSNVKGVKTHHCSSCDGRYYLGPCSGGQGNRYWVYVYAKDGAGKDVAKGKLKLGEY